MKKIGKILGGVAGFALGGPLGLIGAKSLLGKKKKVKADGNSTILIPRRDEARGKVDVSRGLLRRRGGADDILFGAGGIEPMGSSSLFGLPGG